MQFRKKARATVAINIAPLVDVVFLLVIFFAVSTTFLETSGLRLDLPESSTTAKRETQALTVILTVDGELSFDNEVMTADVLESRLRSALAELPATKKFVLLRADSESRHGKVVEIMDLVRAAGADGLTVAARPSGG